MDLHALFAARTGAVLSGPDPRTVERGREVYLRGKVLSLSVDGERRLSATVQGSRASDVYRTTVRFSPAGGRMRVASTCTCPVALNCKHGVAAMFAWLLAQPNDSDHGSLTLFSDTSLADQPAKTDDTVRPDIAASWIMPAAPATPVSDGAERARALARSQRERALRWVRELGDADEPTLDHDLSGRFRLVYVLRRAERQCRLAVWRVEAGAAGKPDRAEPYTSLREHVFAPPSYWRDRDTQAAMVLMREQGGMGGEYVLAGARAGELLMTLAQAGTLYLDEVPGRGESVPIQPAGAVRGELQWQATDDSGTEWRLGLSVAAPLEALFVEPACWLDAGAGRMGLLEVDLPAGLVGWLRNAPAVSAAVAPDVAVALHSKLAGKKRMKAAIPNLPTQHVREVRAPMRPVLRLSDARPGKRVVSSGRTQGDDQAYLVLAFSAQYDGHRTVPLQGTSHRIDLPAGPALLYTDPAAEHAAFETLRAELALLGLLDGKPAEPVQKGALLGGATTLAPGQVSGAAALVLAVPASGLMAVRLRHELAPAMQAHGWQIDDKASAGPTLHRDTELDLGIAEGERDPQARDSRKWFELQSGIRVGKQTIDLAPVLADIVAFGGFDAWRVRRCPKDVLWLTLPDGSHAGVDVARLEPLALAVADWLETAATGGGGEEGPALRLDAMSAARLATALPAVRVPQSLAALHDSFVRFQGLQDVLPPESFTASLRPYQQQGLNWLQFLAQGGLGGILADDMGLGKTVQVLAHLACEQTRGAMKGPVLVVAPTSLVFNWALEARAHAPRLRVLVLTGSHRKRLHGQILDADLVLTSYALLPRDQEVYEPIAWHAVIADEAQSVKNPRTRAAQALHSLTAGHRIAMTGTPLENHLGELWSIMRFAMPDLLGPEEVFRQRYRLPIERRAGSREAGERMQALNRRLRPFLMRRSKADVLDDLPPRTEIIQRIELPSDQRDLYESIRSSMDQRVREALAGAGLARSHIVVLDALLKLRQACCDPALLKLPAARKVRHSAKLEALVELLATLQDEGRKTLVFSQFTSMLDLIETALDRDSRLAGISRVRLDGSTADREGVVRRFQSGQADLFLLSLKAGGVGLNLTAADTVIHYDPWWNPAAENQATDRAHRIGQDKAVFVYKLIAAQTVEERILALQAGKAELANAVLSESLNSAGKSLTQQDLLGLFEPL